MSEFMTKEQFYDKYNVFEYGHRLGHQIVVVQKNNDLMVYIDEGEDLESLYNQLFFSLNVVNYVSYNERKHSNKIDLEDFYIEHFESWEPLADIFTDELVQWNYMGDEKVFSIFVQGGNKEEYRFYQEIDGSAVLIDLIDPSEQELKDTINEYLLQYMGNKAMKWELMSGKRN